MTYLPFVVRLRLGIEFSTAALG